MNSHSLLLFACAVIRGFPMSRLWVFLNSDEMAAVYEFTADGSARNYIRNNRPMWTRRVR